MTHPRNRVWQILAPWTINLALVMATAGAASNWLVAPTAGQATAYSVATSVYAAGQVIFTMSIIETAEKVPFGKLQK